MAETPFRKGSVTQTGVDATGLSSPDLRAASFSREGVVDRSGLFAGEAKAAGIQGIAGGVRDFGQIALDIDEGIAKASLEKDLLDEIDQAGITDDFQEKQQARLEEATLDFTAKQAKANILREEIGEGAAIARLDPEFDDISKRLTNAKRTGAISSDEFELRTREALRKAVAKRPGLIRELTQHAENVLHLSGARERVKMEDKLTAMEGQAEQKKRDQITAQLFRDKLPFNPDLPTDDLLSLLNNYRGQQLAWDQAKQLREANAEISREEGLAILRQQGSAASAGAFQEAHTSMLEAFTTMSLSEAKALSITISRNFESQFDALGRSLGVTNTPEFKDLKKTNVEAIKQLATTLQEATSGDDAARQAKNIMAGYQYAQKRDIFESGINPERVRLLGHLSQYAQFSDLFLAQDHIQKTIQIGMEQIIDGLTDSPNLDKLLLSTTNGKTSDFSNLISSMARSSLPGDNTPPTAERFPSDFEKTVVAANETINRNVSSNPDLAFKTLTETIRNLSDPSIRSNLNNATPSTKAMLVDIGLQQASALEPDRTRFLSNAREQGVVIRPRVLPDGTLSFFTEGNTQKDRDLLRQFNSKFTVKYNDLIKYHSTLFNMSVPETSKLLGEIYGGGTRAQIEEAISFRREGLKENIPSNVKDLIVNEEGFRERAYLDVAGVPTIGYGFTTINGQPVQLGDTISREQADRELQNQIEAHSTFKNRISVPLTRDQEAALSSFEYNLGPNIWDGSGKRIIEAINNGDLEAAAESMRSHNKIRDPNTGNLTEHRAISKRREREIALLVKE